MHGPPTEALIFDLYWKPPASQGGKQHTDQPEVLPEREGEREGGKEL